MVGRALWGDGACNKEAATYCHFYSIGMCQAHAKQEQLAPGTGADLELSQRHMLKAWGETSSPVHIILIAFLTHSSGRPVTETRDKIKSHGGRRC